MRYLLALLLLLLIAGFAWWAAAAPAPVPVAAGGRGGAVHEPDPDEVHAGGHAERSDEGRDAEASAAGRVAVDATPDVARVRATGRLVTAGEPLAGVTVFACKGSSSRPEVLEQVVTGPDGSFALRHDQPRYWLAAVGEGVPDHWHTGRRALEDLGDIVVPPPGVVRGVVQTVDGRPVARAEVTLLPESYARLELPGRAGGKVAHTDAAGRFRFDGVGERVDKVRVRADGFARASRYVDDVPPGREVVVEVEVRVGVTLRGVVVDHRGQPLAGARMERGYGQAVAVDGLGRFVCEHFRAGEHLQFAAPGHLERTVKRVAIDELLHVQLERAVSLRGIVRGAGGRPGAVRLEPAALSPGAVRLRSYRQVYEWLDVVRDGGFRIDGLARSDFEVTVRIPGVGASRPQRVELRDDVEITFEMVPARTLTVAVRDDAGQPVAGASLVRDDGVLEYPRLYQQPARELLQRIRSSRSAQPRQAIEGGQIELAVLEGEGVAVLVEADGHLPVPRSFQPGEVPDRIAVTLVRSGGLRGVVHGGSTSCDRSVAVVAAPVVGAPDRPSVGRAEARIATATVARDGTFAIGRLPPGSYRAVLERSNTATAGGGTAGLPLLDEGAAASATFDVVAGAVAEIAIDEPRLGRLTGRVLQDGRPVANAVVAVARPPRRARGEGRQARVGGGRRGGGGGGDWDDERTLLFAPSQRSAADGRYTILYRDEGPVEVRLRHPDALVTSTARIVELPPPGADVVRDFALPGGELRGRFPVERLDPSARERVAITLFRSDRVLHDPFYLPHHGLSLDLVSPKIEHPDRGRFAFRGLRPGTWTLRVHFGVGDVLWQDDLEVRDGVVDVGELPVVDLVEFELALRWRQGSPGALRGAWLRRPRPGQPSPWAATCRATDEVLRGRVLPGRYEVVPFGRRGAEQQETDLHSIGISGEALAAPVGVTIRSDGSVVPIEIEFSTAATPAGK